MKIKKLNIKELKNNQPQAIVKTEELENINAFDLKEIKKIIKKVGGVNTFLFLSSLNLPTTTFYQALKDKCILDKFLSEIKELTDNIKQSKDWRSRSYILDKITEVKKSKAPGNLIGLQIIVDGHQPIKDTGGG